MVGLFSSKKSYFKLTPEERKAELAQSEATARRAQRPVGIVTISKKVYQTAKTAKDKAKAAKDVFKTKKQKEKEALREKVFREESEKMERAKFRGEHLSKTTGKTPEYLAMEKKDRDKISAAKRGKESAEFTVARKEALKEKGFETATEKKLDVQKERVQLAREKHEYKVAKEKAKTEAQYEIDLKETKIV